MKKNLSLALSALILVLGLLSMKEAGAVIIEGVTPSGKFKSVYVTEAGRLPVETTTGAAQHVIVDSGTVSAFQGGGWTVDAKQSGTWNLSLTNTGSTGLVVTASTVATVASGQFNFIFGVPQQVLTSNAARTQSVFCNTGTGATLWVGGSGVSTSNGMPIVPGSCFSPDVPASFIGTLWAISTAPASGAVIYFTP